VVNFTPLLLYPRERAPGTHWVGGWVNPRAGLDDVEERRFLPLPGLEIRPLSRPARSQSLISTTLPRLLRMRGFMTNNKGFWIGFTGTALRLQSIITAHNQWLPRTLSIPYWTSVFSSAMTKDKRRQTELVLGSPFTTTTLSEDCLTNIRILRLTVSQSVGLGVEPNLGLMTTYLFFFWQLRSCFLWGDLSDERTGLSFVYAAGICQLSLSRVRVPWYSRPYFTVSNLRLPFSSPPTTWRINRSSLSLYSPARIHGNVCCLAVVTENVLTAPLPSNGPPASVHWYSGFPAVLTKPLPSNGHINYNTNKTVKKNSKILCKMHSKTERKARLCLHLFSVSFAHVRFCSDWV
jgi:hypothetical protein